MVRSPGGRLHVRTREQFELELKRVEVEVAGQETADSRFSIDAIFAHAGYVAVDGYFVEVDSGAQCDIDLKHRG